jgi:ATP-dependent Lhr-like helicase
MGGGASAFQRNQSACRTHGPWRAKSARRLGYNLRMGLCAEAANSAATCEALAWAHPVVQAWFTAKFGTPTEPQIAGWPAILRGEPTLISAPTGSGKTLAAFLVCIDKLLRAALAGDLQPRTHVLYISPLKALSNDVQKNLDGPLREIQQLALASGYLCPEIRTGVRTGDTLPKERAAMLRTPPHILVTTPESLYILLTAGKSRRNLECIETVIVDEIHAIADDKRGSHLALSLERLDALVCGENRLSPGAMLTARTTPPQRIGLSATQNPIELVANFLTGGTGRSATILQVGQRRTLDLAIEVPSEELGSLTTGTMWEEIYDKLARVTETHRSTLVFVNTRRLVEKLAFELTARLGEDAVAGHHGSLSRTLRLDAEQRLKNGEIKILIATASLELGIDIGTVDLVCQIATTRAVAVAMQRVGRAGHWRGAVPKGIFFATTRDDLMEQAALMRKMTAGELDRLEIPEAPIDVLMQQIVAACGAESWEEDALYRVVRRAWPYRELTRAHFDEVLTLLHEGIENTRGRYGAYLLRDRVQGHLHARRGARMTAIGNGGAIPDTSLFAVMLQPENVQIATLDEHFAVDSSAGDVVLLGNTSWRIQRIDPQGKVLVEDAHGAPPTIPFWEGEAPQRTAVLCDGVAELRTAIDERTRNVKPRDLIAGFGVCAADETQIPFGNDNQKAAGIPDTAGAPTARSLIAGPREAQDTPQQEILATLTWLREQCFVPESAARQMIAYIVAGRAALGAVPTKTTIIAERFFDEGGGQQLILHAPFGGRLNKAWGLALRKRFCRGFAFELQAAATDNGINISLAEQHSFPLEDVFQFLSVQTARTLLEQACIPSPLFKNRWRWAAGRSLQLLRMQRGKRVAPQIQRSRSDDLLASVFPHASACPETMTGDIEIPDHPLGREVMRDTLSEAMDIDGLNELLAGIASGRITCLAVDTPVPSVFAHELVHAMPYSFLDEADAAARRTRAVTLRRTLPDAVTAGAGILDQAAIDTVRSQLWPDVRDEHEMHDLLLQLVCLPVKWLEAQPAQRSAKHWPHFLTRLEDTRRAACIEVEGETMWFAAERIAEAGLLWPGNEGLTACSAASLREVSSSEDSLSFRSEAEESALASAADAPARVIPGTEERPEIQLSTRDVATTTLIQGWLQILGPVTAASLAATTHLHWRSLHQSLLGMEMQGLAMRGAFEHASPADDAPQQIEWCERRVLQRIHRLTLTGLRKQVEPVAPNAFLLWLFTWHHVAPGTQLDGEEGVLAALEQLEGFEAPAIEWERTLLPARVANYDPQWLDNLCLAGVVGWGRVSPHPAWLSGDEAPRRVVPTNAAPITFYLREGAEWLNHAMAAKCVDEARLARSLSAPALAVRHLLGERGAAFMADLQRLSGLTKLETATALWELATAGLAAADGFDQLRAMMDPRRKSQALPQTALTSLRKRAAARTTAGRWSLFDFAADAEADLRAGADKTLRAGVDKTLRAGVDKTLRAAPLETNLRAARAADAALEAHAKVLLCRYGVLFRELLTREANAPKWRDLAPMLRRLEARGEVRGGRFVSGAFGEQFALPEAADQLRTSRRTEASQRDDSPLPIAAADPLNLAGILVPGERVAAVPGSFVEFLRGAVVRKETVEDTSDTNVLQPKRSRNVAAMLRSGAAVQSTTSATTAAPMRLFQ